MHSGPFGCHTKLGAKHAKLVQKFVPQSRVGLTLQRTHPIHPIGTQTDVLVLFRTICVHSGPLGCLTNSSAKQSELVQKFVPRSRVGLFRNERTRPTPLDPKLTFWCVSYYIHAFGTVWLPYETRCKTCRTSAKVCATKWHRNFSQERTRYSPLDPKLMFWCVSYNLSFLGTV